IAVLEELLPLALLLAALVLAFHLALAVAEPPAPDALAFVLPVVALDPLLVVLPVRDVLALALAGAELRLFLRIAVGIVLDPTALLLVVLERALDLDRLARRVEPFHVRAFALLADDALHLVAL